MSLAPPDTVTSAGGLFVPFPLAVRRLLRISPGAPPVARLRIELALQVRHDPTLQELWAEYERRYPDAARRVAHAVTTSAFAPRRRPRTARGPAGNESSTTTLADAVGTSLEDAPHRACEQVVERLLRQAGPDGVGDMDFLVYPWLKVRRLKRQRP